VDPENIKVMSGAIWNFSKGTGLHRGYSRLRGTKGPL